MGDSVIIKLMKEDIKKIREQSFYLGIKVIVTKFNFINLDYIGWLLRIKAIIFH